MRIQGKQQEGSLHAKDKLLGSAFTETLNGIDQFVTRNFTLDSLKTFVQGAVATGDINLKTNGGIIRTSDELLIDLGASNITGQLANSDLANSSITINGSAISLGGTVTTPNDNTQLSQEQVEDFVGGMLDGTETFISVSYDDTDGNIDFVVPVKDEDDMTSNSDTHLATQQSIKAYVDNSIVPALTTEQVQDIVGAMVSGNTETNITVTYQDSDGTLDFASTDTNTQLTTEEVQDIVGAMFTSNTETRISATYVDDDGTIDLVADDMNHTAEEIQDIVGAMFTSNTETNIAATYQDADGTIDLVTTPGTTTLSFVDSSNDIILRNTPGGANAALSNNDIKIVAGSNVTLTHIDANNFRIASQAFGTVHTVNSEANMISATSTGGDIVIRTDVSKTFIHNGGSAGSAADFSELQFSGINNIALTAGDGITLSRTTITNTDNDLTITNALATETTTGGVQLFSNTDQSVAANSVTTTASRTYGLQLNSADQGVVNVPWTDTVYTHPTHDGDDISIDTGALSGAVVISDLDFNVTTDTLGHVTDANASVATRTLTLANLGYTGDTDANNYVLPTAAASTLGGVKVGSRLSISTGVLSADSQTDNNFTTTLKNKLDGISDSADVTDATTVAGAGAVMDSEVTNLSQVKGFDSSDYATAAQGTKADSAQQPPSEGAFANGDKTKLDGIAAGAQVNVATNLSQVTAASQLTIQSSTGTNIVVAEADGTNAGLMSKTHHDKLDGIESGATADQSNAEIVAAIVASGSISDSDKGTFRSNIGAGTSSLALGTTDSTALAGNTTTISGAQSTKLGHISVTQAVNLDTMESNITTNNSKVSNVTTDLGVTANGTSLTVSSSDGTNASIPAATTSAWGAMTDEDKTKLDGIETGATADQTNTEIRDAVEAAEDSNTFTDADHNKLNAIEANATADQTDEEIQDIVGGMVTGNTETGITVTYQDSDGTIDFVVASQTDENFTTADHTKLNGIETSATADQTITTGNGLSGGGTGDVTLTNSLLSDGKFFTLTANAAGGTLSLAQGLGASWNDSSGSGEIDIFFRDGGTSHATNTLYFHSYNGTGTQQILKLGGGSSAANSYVSVSGRLLVSKDKFEIDSTAVTTTAAELNKLDGLTASTTELNVLDGPSAGTVSASKAVVVDSNKDITGFRNVTLTGTLTTPTLGTAGNIEIDNAAPVLILNDTTSSSTSTSYTPTILFKADDVTKATIGKLSDSTNYFTAAKNHDGPVNIVTSDLHSGHTHSPEYVFGYEPSSNVYTWGLQMKGNSNTSNSLYMDPDADNHNSSIYFGGYTNALNVTRISHNQSLGTLLMDVPDAGTSNISVKFRQYNVGGYMQNMIDFEDDGDIKNINGSYGTISSDERVKENIVDATPKLNDILSLNVKNFNFIGDNKKQIGLIAQDVESVFPSWVQTSDTRIYKTHDENGVPLEEQGELVSGLADGKSLKVGMEFAVLVKTIQELNAKIVALEARVQTLENN